MSVHDLVSRNWTRWKFSGSLKRPDRLLKQPAGTCHTHRLHGAYDRIESYQNTERHSALAVLHQQGAKP